ncbi:MAG: HAD-IA family hydrolase [Thermoguttaceae bacterium]
MTRRPGAGTLEEMSQAVAAIFDMDGVLVDTYQAHYRSWLALARGEGLDFSEEDFAQTFGRTSREVIAKLWGGRRLGEARITAMDAEKEAAFRRVIREEVPLMPGAIPLLESLRAAGFRLAVGSSAPPENVKLVLDWRNLRDLFDAVVTGADVARGKPDPQVFQLAAQRLGAPPRRCVVIEDAPAGLAAAAAAGMAGVGLVSTGRTRAALADADLLVDSLSELSPEVLQGVIARRTAP